MVHVMFISAWGAYAARARAEISASQAEPLLATGVAVLVEDAPEALPPDVRAQTIAPAPARATRRRK